MKIEVTKTLFSRRNFNVRISEISSEISAEQLQHLIEIAVKEAIKTLEKEYKHSSGNIKE